MGWMLAWYVHCTRFIVFGPGVGFRLGADFIVGSCTAWSGTQERHDPIPFAFALTTWHGRLGH